MKNELQPFNFDGASVRVITIDGAPWFVGKDIAAALGYTNPQKAVRDHCKSPRPVGGERFVHPSAGGALDPQTVIISEGDVMRLIVSSQLPAAERFERWVFDEVLPTIRKTGSYTMPKATTPSVAAKEFRALFGIARLIGCDRNVAAISANQAIAKLTGFDVLQTLGHTHLVAERQDTLWFTPTELGQRIGVSGRQFNLLLAEAGLQAKRGDKWEPLAAANGLVRLLDTGKTHGGTAVTQMKWSGDVLSRIEREAA